MSDIRVIEGVAYTVLRLFCGPAPSLSSSMIGLGMRSWELRGGVMDEALLSMQSSVAVLSSMYQQ